MFNFVFTLHENSKYYGPYADLETCLASVPAIVRKCLKDIDFEDEYGPEPDEDILSFDTMYSSYDDGHEGMFPYGFDYPVKEGISYDTVDHFYITEATLIKMLREYRFYSPETYCHFRIIQLEQAQ